MQGVAKVNCIRGTRVKSFNKEKLLIFAGLALVRLSLIWAFFAFVVPRYSTDFYINFNETSIVYSEILFWINAFFLVKMIDVRRNHLSALLFSLLFMVAYIPTSVLCAFMWNNFLYSITVSFFWLITLIVLSRKKLVIKDKEMKQVFKINRSDSKLIFYSFITICFAVLCYIIYNYNKFQFDFSFKILYELRAQVKESLSTSQSLFIYIMAAVVNPILIGVSIKKRNFFLFAVVVVMQVMAFMLGGDKFYLLILLVGIFAAIIYKKKYLPIIPLLLGGIIVIFTTFIVITEGTFFEEWIYDISVRRVFFTPAHLNYYYFDFFQTNQYVWFVDHALLSRILIKVFNMQLPYQSIPVADILGNYYWGATGTGTGTFGNAFSQVGYLCLIIYPILYLLICNVFDKLTLHFDPTVYVPFVLSLTVFLMDVSISGIELTYGLFAFLLFRLMFKDFQEKKKCSNKIRGVSLNGKRRDLYREKG